MVKNRFKVFLIIFVLCILSNNLFANYIKVEWEKASDSTDYYLVLQTYNNEIEQIYLVSQEKNNIIVRDNINKDFFVVTNDNLKYSIASKKYITNEEIITYSPNTLIYNNKRIGYYYNKENWVVYNLFDMDKNYILDNIKVKNTLLVFKPSIKLPTVYRYEAMFKFDKYIDFIKLAKDKKSGETIKKLDEKLFDPIKKLDEKSYSGFGLSFNYGIFLPISYHILIYNAYFIAYPTHNFGHSFQFSIDSNFNKNAAVSLDFGFNTTNTKLLNLKYNYIPLSLNYKYRIYLGEGEMYIPISFGLGLVAETADAENYGLLGYGKTELGFGIDFDELSLEIVSDFQVALNKRQKVISYSSSILSIGLNYRF